MKNLELDYTNEYQVRNYINTTICDIISEDLKTYDCDYYEALFQIIGGLGDVIYTYQAKKVAEAFGINPFDESEMTGERYNSYNQMAVDAIYNAYNGTDKS